FKESGGAAAAVPVPAQAETPAPAATPAAPAPAAARPGASVPEPDYIEITGAMSPDQVRKARIQNSKLRSAYAKALKAAGLDPAAALE
ncbi:MAG: hypothetical protein ACRDHL_15865, partial [Candidatus Promineifilaceae bacterium]